MLVLSDTGNRTTKDKLLLYMDLALRTTSPKAILISFLKNSAGHCYTRTEAGFATFNVQQQKGVDFRDTLFVLDDVLNSSSKDVVVKSDSLANVEQEDSQTHYKSE